MNVPYLFLRLTPIAVRLAAALIVGQTSLWAGEPAASGHVIRLPPVIVKANPDEPIVFELPDVDTPPKVVKMVFPKPPEQMSSGGLGARVKLSFVIGATGKVRDVQAVEAVLFDIATNTDLDQTTLEKWVKEGRLPRRTRNLPIDQVSLEYAVEFGKEAVKAVEQSSYSPGIKAFAPVATRMNTVIVFANPARPNLNKSLLPAPSLPRNR